MGTATFIIDEKFLKLFTKAHELHSEIVLVHDEGLYFALGTPLKNRKDNVFVYAKGCSPSKNKASYHKAARKICGGDDFVETVSKKTSKWMEEAYYFGYTSLSVNFGKGEIRYGASEWNHWAWRETKR